MESGRGGCTTLTLVILAAGNGRPHGGLERLEPVGPAGETLMEYALYDSVRCGSDRVVLVARPETEAEFRRSIVEGIRNGQ